MTILYENTLLKSVGHKGPRKITIAVPSVIHPTDYYTDPDSLVKAARSTTASTTGIEVFTNKVPRWNSSIHGYFLDFSPGRVKEPSAKNFQIISSAVAQPHADSCPVIAQFGRINETEYALDFASPFTPLMAFGLALSSLDFKICCE